MKIEIAVLSKPGGRATNEDACGYWNSDRACCMVLSDGAGGHGGGDTASRNVVGTILREFSANPSVSVEDVGRLIQHANACLVEAQQGERRLRDMRATVAVVTVDRPSGFACWGHLGDSRIYAFRSGRIRFQSRDHSVMQSMLDAGLVDATMLRKHPQRGVLLAALGTHEPFEPSLSGGSEPVFDGDVFLMCSDGLWEYVEEAAMERLLATSESAERWLASLEAELLTQAHPGHDNYSAIAVWFGDRDDATRIVRK